MTTIEYASPTTPPMAGSILRQAISTIAFAAGFLIAAASVHLAGSAYFALHVPTDCGTFRHVPEEMLYYAVPFAFVVPAGAWTAAKLFGFDTLLCRCSLWMALAGWSVSSISLACSS